MALFEKLPLDHPARAPFNLFAQSSDTVRSGIIQGLGTRLQVLQNCCLTGWGLRLERICGMAVTRGWMIMFGSFVSNVTGHSLKMRVRSYTDFALFI